MSEKIANENYRFSTILIGLGDIGFKYDLHLNESREVLTHAKALTIHKNFNLLAAVDINSQQKDIFEKKYKVPFFNSIEEAFARFSPDLVIISTPTKTHKSILSKVLSISQPKVILCEKPLAQNVKDAEEMKLLCISKGVKLYVNYIRRCDFASIEVNSRIKKGEIKLPIVGSSFYSNGLLNNASHLVNLLEYWFGKPEEIKLISNKKSSNGDDTNPDFLIEFNKVKINFQSICTNKYSHNHLILLAENGKLEYKDEWKNYYWYKIKSSKEFLGHRFISNSYEHINSTMYQYQLNVYNMVYKAFKNKKNTLCTGEQALSTLKYLEMLK